MDYIELYMAILKANDISPYSDYARTIKWQMDNQDDINNFYYELVDGHPELVSAWGEYFDYP